MLLQYWALLLRNSHAWHQDLASDAEENKLFWCPICRDNVGQILPTTDPLVHHPMWLNLCPPCRSIINLSWSVFRPCFPYYTSRRSGHPYALHPAMFCCAPSPPLGPAVLPSISPPCYFSFMHTISLSAHDDPLVEDARTKIGGHCHSFSFYQSIGPKELAGHI
jgi:hypothetical protein